MRKAEKTSLKSNKKSSKNKYLLIFVCIFSACILIFGTTLGIVVGVRNARCVVKYENVRLEEGEIRYLASVFKSRYIMTLVRSGVMARDTEQFWQTTAESGETYADMLRLAFSEYIAGIAVKNALYLNTESFGKTERELVRDKIDERLMYLPYKSKAGLDAASDELGFDYDGMNIGTQLLYKADAVFSAIYGADGSNIANYKSECESYLDTYSHVALIFLMNERVYVYNEAGEMTYDENGEPITRELSESERALRTETAERLREYIKNLNDGNDNAMSAETFEKYMKESSDTDPDMISRGYYLHKDAAITSDFAAAYPEVVERAFDMNIGEYAEVECEGGVCFIYKYEPTEGAYADSDNVFFSDFYYNAANYSFGESVKALAKRVEFKESFDEIDIVSIPANSTLTVNFGS